MVTIIDVFHCNSISLHKYVYITKKTKIVEVTKFSNRKQVYDTMKKYYQRKTSMGSRINSSVSALGFE